MPRPPDGRPAPQPARGSTQALSAAPALAAGLALAVLLAALPPTGRVVRADPTADPAAAPTAAPAAFPYVRVRAATVEILVDGHLAGSGWVATPEGAVVTAAHMVPDRTARVEVLLGERRLAARLRAVHRGDDLALLALSASGDGSPYAFLEIARALPPPGATVWLLGAPVYRHGVLLHGTVARAEPTFEWYGTTKQYVEVVHVAASTPRGTSGAPWMDGEGRVVALQSGSMAQDGVPVGVAFAVPCDAVAPFLAGGVDVATATLGSAFEEIWEQPREFLARFPPRTEGVVVKTPLPDGPLAQVGVEAGAVVLSVEGRRVRYRDDLLGALRRRRPGEEVRLLLLRPDHGGTRRVTVPLGSE